MEIPKSIILIIIGLIVLLFGYKIKKIGFFIIWFMISYYLMGFLMPTLNSWIPQIAGNDFWQTLLPFAGGLLLGLLGFSVEKFCVGGITFILTILIIIQYFGTMPSTILIAAVFGAIVAAAAVALMKPAIIVMTSAAGAYALTTSLITIFTIDQSTFFFPLLLGITIIGSVSQFIRYKGIE